MHTPSVLQKAATYGNATTVDCVVERYIQTIQWRDRTLMLNNTGDTFVVGGKVTEVPWCGSGEADFGTITLWRLGPEHGGQQIKGKLVTQEYSPVKGCIYLSKASAYRESGKSKE